LPFTGNWRVGATLAFDFLNQCRPHPSSVKNKYKQPSLLQSSCSQSINLQRLASGVNLSEIMVLIKAD